MIYLKNKNKKTDWAKKKKKYKFATKILFAIYHF